VSPGQQLKDAGSMSSYWVEGGGAICFERPSLRKVETTLKCNCFKVTLLIPKVSWTQLLS